jgi:transposase
MNKQKETDTSLAVAKEERIIKLGMDVHAGQITICRQEGGCLPQPAQKMSWEKALVWIGELVKSGAKIYSCYEAGPCGYGLHRALTSVGVINLVVAPQRWDERGERVKTDPRDAGELVDRLDRYLRGNRRVFSVVYVPTVEQEQRRSVVRQRGMMLKERNRCVLRGRSLLLLQGLRAPAGWWRPAEWEQYRAQLSGVLQEQIEPWEKQALQFEAQVAWWESKARAQYRGRRLPKGLGTLTAALLESEVVDWQRFHNRREVASYTGLCPSESSSGARRRQGAITKHGNRRVRHYLLEAVWRLEKWQPQYRPLAKLRAASGTRARKRAAVAVARRLAIDLWRLATGQSTSERLGLAMVQAPD